MRYLKVVFMLLGVYVLAPAFFWNVFWVVVAAEMARLIFSILLRIGLVQLRDKTCIALAVLALGVSLIEWHCLPLCSRQNRGMALAVCSSTV